MKLGMMNDPRKPLIEEIRWCGESGFDFIDLTIEGPMASLEQIDVKAARKVLDEYNLGVVGHTAWYIPFGSPIETIRQASIAEAATCLHTFIALGSRLMNVHLLPGVSIFDHRFNIDLQGKSFAKLADIAEPFNIEIIFENPANPRISSEDILGILSHDSRLGFHLDVGHAHIAKLSLDDLLAQVGTRLKHVHFSDNRGISDDHMPIGAGHIDWRKVVGSLKKVNYDATITLEVFAKEMDLVRHSANLVRRYWNEQSNEN